MENPYHDVNQSVCVTTKVGNDLKYGTTTKNVEKLALERVSFFLHKKHRRSQALLIRSVKSSLALLLEKVAKLWV